MGTWKQRAKRAWWVLLGRDEREQRALSLVCATLQHLELSPVWDLSVCRVIAQEAQLRGFARASSEGFFIRTEESIELAKSVPLTKIVIKGPTDEDRIH